MIRIARLLSRLAGYAMLVALGACLAGAAPLVDEGVSNPLRLFANANEDYRVGRYDEAAHKYRLMLSAGVESAAVYYNLGNALLKRGHRGEALWAYLKAKRLAPRDADLRSNLSYAASLVPSAEPVSVRPAVVIRWLTAAGRFSTDELIAAWMILWWLALGLWAARGWWRQAAFVRHGAWAMGVAAGGVLLMLVAQTAGVDAVPTAVAVTEGVSVRFAPQEGGTVHFTLPEGAVVRVLQREAGWLQVQRADGRSGWVVEPSLKAL